MKVNMKKILIISVFVILYSEKLSAHMSEEFAALLLNSPIGYQQGFGFKTPYFRSSFDANITLTILNFGYNFNEYYKSSAFIGIGIGSILQFQYGYCFHENNHLMRIRSDLPLYSVTKNKKSITNYCSIGVYYDYAFKSINRSSSLGISVSFNLSTLVGRKIGK